jgi:hypothetical protein
MKLWRPRFTIRTLAIVVTLVCAYLACWMPTRREAARIGSPENPTPWFNSDAGRACTIIDNAYSPVPFGVSQVEWEPEASTKVKRQYYLWFFGHKRPLPLWTNYAPRPDDGQAVQLYRDRQTGRIRSD